MKRQTEWEKKLSQLLWEYMEKKKKNPEWFLEISTVLMCSGDSKAMDSYMISKQFWFIERLVKKNKIDISKLSRESDMWFGDKYEREESLLMLLAISDNPIEDLISYLK